MNTTHVTSIFKTINFCSLVLHLIFRAPQMGLHKDINPMLLMKAKDTESFTITSLGHHTLWSSQLYGRIPCRTSFIWILAAMNTRHLVTKRPKMFPARPELTHKLLIIAVWSIPGSVGETPKTFYGGLLSVGKICKRKIFFFTPSASVGGSRPVFIYFHVCMYASTADMPVPWLCAGRGRKNHVHLLL